MIFLTTAINRKDAKPWQYHLIPEAQGGYPPALCGSDPGPFATFTNMNSNNVDGPEWFAFRDVCEACKKKALEAFQ